MEIGLFQLENLLMSRTQFCFLDLRENLAPSMDPVLDAIFNKATPLKAGVVENHLTQNISAKDFPIVLICEDGKTSAKVAQKLEASGLTNVYVVARGAEGLRSEL